jgi:hypothetical protein
MKRKNRIVAVVLAVASIYVAPIQTGRCADQPGVRARPANPSLVSFYEVPLVCPAAPQIGCGSSSKPLLLELEQSKVVSEAWLNRAGTIMAVTWFERTKPHQRLKAIAIILKRYDIDPKELTGDARQRALKDFQSGSDWYRGADVDRLSEEEAGIMAGRLIRKIRSMVTLDDQNCQAMQARFAEILARRLTGDLPDRASAQKEILKICRQHLNDQEVSRLQDALKDFRPNRDEP